MGKEVNGYVIDIVSLKDHMANRRIMTFNQLSEKCFDVSKSVCNSIGCGNTQQPKINQVMDICDALGLDNPIMILKKEW